MQILGILRPNGIDKQKAINLLFERQSARYTRKRSVQDLLCVYFFLIIKTKRTLSSVLKIFHSDRGRPQDKYEDRTSLFINIAVGYDIVRLFLKFIQISDKVQQLIDSDLIRN